MNVINGGISMAELLPCPFCGGEAEILTAESMRGGYLFGIMCNDCCSRGDVYETAAEAIAAWNTRANDTLTGEKVTTQDSETVTTRTCRMEQIQPPKILEGWYRCSTCGEVYPPCNPEIAKWALQYCPRCGAKVVGE